MDHHIESTGVVDEGTANMRATCRVLLEEFKEEHGDALVKDFHIWWDGDDRVYRYRIEATK